MKERERREDSPEVRREVVFKNVMDDSLTVISILFQTALRVALGRITTYIMANNCIMHQDKIHSPTTSTTWTTDYGPRTTDYGLHMEQYCKNNILPLQSVKNSELGTIFRKIKMSKKTCIQVH